MTSPQATILIVDDEEAILRLLRLELSGGNYNIVTARNAEEALAVVEESQPDLVILDIILPGATGLELLGEIRARTAVPIILLSAHTSEDIRIEALKLGANDFISKPFSPEHVTQSVAFLLAQQAGAASEGWLIDAGDLQIDLHQRVVRRDGAAIPLSRSEWMIVELLARARGQPLLYQELLSQVWGSVYRDDLDYLRMWISRLRAKLGGSNDAPTAILPYLDIGYRLNLS